MKCIFTTIVAMAFIANMRCFCQSKNMSATSVKANSSNFISKNAARRTMIVPKENKEKFVMPHENDEHEGTWLQWPHSFEYGTKFRDRLESTWIAMTKALYKQENVHIIAYNTNEVKRITNVLQKSGLSSPLPKSIDFHISPTNDVWVRDNGPIFVKNITSTDSGKKSPIILDWGFNGWGEKFNYDESNAVPESVGIANSIPTIDLNEVVLEGGAIELDGDGTMMATKSSTTASSRNALLSQEEIENYFRQYLGVQKFIWLNGKAGSDITDMHIDGLMKFVNSTTVVTTIKKDLKHHFVPDSDINILLNATNRHGIPYNYVYLPLTKKNVRTTYGFIRDVGYKGTYINYYVANGKVLMPSYNDENDLVAQNILQKLYPDRVVVKIDCRNLFKQGGMVHCVTQQQPK
jgi:agmatine deiminase